MAKLLTPEALEFRALVERCDGRQAEIAEALGVTQPAVSSRLNSQLHGSWWKAFKTRRSKRRSRERRRRSYRRQQERARMAWGDLAPDRVE